MDRRMLVIGGGYIDLEIAAVASVAGVRGTLIETADRILQRVAAAETSDYFRALHRSHDVDIREKRSLTRLFGDDGQVIGAELNDGKMLSIDCVMVGIGILPNDDLARDAGLAVENGIAVDRCCRTSDPAIFAAGDCTSFT
jgi:3-phenylpropionate/trans-cinnamate dioxygenase ferredoxin reductase subunit